MNKLSKLLVVIVMTIALGGCATVANLGDAVCRTLVGGSIAEAGCDDLQDYVQPEADVAEAI
jgi:uncharacterized protein YceK